MKLRPLRACRRSEVWHNGPLPAGRRRGGPSGRAGVGDGRGDSSPDRRPTTLRARAAQLDNIVTGELSSMELTRRLSAKQLRHTAQSTQQPGASSSGRHQGRRASFEDVTRSAACGFSCWGRLRTTSTSCAWRGRSSSTRAKTRLTKLHQDPLHDEERLGALSPRIVAN